MTAARVASDKPTRAALRSAPVRYAGMVATALVADLALNPTHTHLPLCPLHAFTGLNCPFCGGLRSAYELTHGRLIAGLHDNALFVLALPLLIGYWIDWMIRSRRGLPGRAVPRVVSVVAIVIAAAFMIVRNLPIGRALSPT